MSIRIILADDHTIMQAGLRSLLEKEEDIEVVAEAQDGRDAVKLSKELLPHVVIMDISMPHLNGIDATRQLKDEMPEVKVVILTIFDLKAYRDAAMASGANGYVTKGSLFEELLPTIRGAFGVCGRE